MTTELAQRRANLDRQTGIGLVEVVLATAVASIGVLAAAGVSLVIGSQARLAGWETDQALAARSALEAVRQTGYARAVSGSGVVGLGPRLYRVTHAVTAPGSRLKHVRVTVAAPPGRQPAAFETRLARLRPLPAAP